MRRVIVRARFTAGNTVMLRAHHFAASAWEEVKNRHLRWALHLFTMTPLVMCSCNFDYFQCSIFFVCMCVRERCACVLYCRCSNFYIFVLILTNLPTKKLLFHKFVSLWLQLWSYIYIHVYINPFAYIHICSKKYVNVLTTNFSSLNLF